MKKLLTIVFFSVFCLGAKALGVVGPTGINLLRAHHMDVTLRGGKKNHFENECIEFTAWNGSNGWGCIRLRVQAYTIQEYDEFERVVGLLKSKIPALELCKDEHTNSTGIRSLHMNMGDRLNGYQAVFDFRFEDIDQIDLY